MFGNYYESIYNDNRNKNVKKGRGDKVKDIVLQKTRQSKEIQNGRGPK